MERYRNEDCVAFYVQSRTLGGSYINYLSLSVDGLLQSINFTTYPHHCMTTIAIFKVKLKPTS